MKRSGRSPLLEYQNVTVLKGGRPVLDAVTLTVRPGENLAVLGPNGAGKSSLIKTITREYYPVPGPEVLCRIWGEDHWHVADLRLKLGIVSNDLMAWCLRPITGEAVILSGFFSSIGLDRQVITRRMRRKADEILAFLEIEDLRDRRMNEMSSGEARRFLIGRALVHDPQALILDEPANSLDLHAWSKFRNVLRKIARSGISIILVTHNIHDIIPEIRRVALMKEGRICHDGRKEHVLTSRNISALFSTRLDILKRSGHYYAVLP